MDITHDPITAGLVKKLIDKPSSGFPLGSLVSMPSVSDPVITFSDSTWMRSGYVDTNLAEYPEFTSAGLPFYAPLGAVSITTGPKVTSNIVRCLRTSSGAIIMFSIFGSVIVNASGNGMDWVKYNTFATSELADVAYTSTGNALFIATKSEVLRSTDNGATWQSVLSRVANAKITAAGSTVVVYTPGSTTEAFRSLNSGLTWSPITIGVAVQRLEISPLTGTIITYYSSVMQRMVVGATTFTAIAGSEGSGGFSVRRSDGYMFALRTNGSSLPVVMRFSIDDGVTWNNVTTTTAGNLITVMMRPLPNGTVGFLDTNNAYYSVNAAGNTTLTAIYLSTNAYNMSNYNSAVTGPDGEWIATESDYTLGSSSGITSFQTSLILLKKNATTVIQPGIPADFHSTAYAELSNGDVIIGSGSQVFYFASGVMTNTSGMRVVHPYALESIDANIYCDSVGTLYALRKTTGYRAAYSNTSGNWSGSIFRSIDYGRTWTFFMFSDGLSFVGKLTNSTTFVLSGNNIRPSNYVSTGVVTALKGAMVTPDNQYLIGIDVTTGKLVRTSDLVNWEFSSIVEIAPATIADSEILVTVRADGAICLSHNYKSYSNGYYWGYNSFRVITWTSWNTNRLNNELTSRIQVQLPATSSSYIGGLASFTPTGNLVVYATKWEPAASPVFAGAHTSSDLGKSWQVIESVKNGDSVLFKGKFYGANHFLSPGNYCLVRKPSAKNIEFTTDGINWVELYNTANTGLSYTYVTTSDTFIASYDTSIVPYVRAVGDPTRKEGFYMRVK